MPNRLERLRAAAPERVVPFVGTGVSVAASGREPHASWIGLIEDGLLACQRLVPDLPSDWAEKTRSRLDGADAITFLTVADEVVLRLRRVSDGREYVEWLASTVGKLELVPAGERLIDAIGGLGDLIVTTNYDLLLAERLGRDPVTWTKPERYMAVLEKGADPAVVHLHGLVSDPDSVILGSADYERLLGDDLQKFLKEHLFAFSSFVFIGCGEGLRDRSIAPVLQLLDELLPAGTREHFHLVRGTELRAAMRAPLASSVSPVAYGSNFDDLAAFVEKLGTPGADLATSQDPSFYEGRGAVTRARTALLDLAGPAEEGVQSALEAVHRALRAVGRLERRMQLPAGSATWELAEQQAVHEQLASSASGPSERLAFNVAVLEQILQPVEHDLGQLLAPRFAQSRDRLRPLLAALADLGALCSELQLRCGEAAAALGSRRAESSHYRPVVAAAERAREHADEVATVLATLQEEFGLPSSTPQSTRPTE